VCELLFPYRLVRDMRMLMYDARTCASSIYTSTYTQIKEEFGISQMLAVSGLSLFVMGLGIGTPSFVPPAE
jgi:hypothetical protein